MGPRSPDSPVFAKHHRRSDTPPNAAEDRSQGDSTSCGHTSVATPSSVMVGSPLTRELSDLSGSYVNGSPMPHHHSRGGVPRNIFGREQPWRQAYALSTHATTTTDACPPKFPVLNNTTSSSSESVIMDKNGGVEVVPPAPQEGAVTSRFPIVIALMLPSQKTYELLQLWLDLNDSVRTVLQSIRQGIPNTWNQDYDGLIQPRAGRLNQLINCLSIKQFAVVPNEIWVAKPWALDAEHTTRYANGLLNHLKDIGVISQGANEAPRRTATPDGDEAVSRLSLAAKKRIYAPDGILSHHHAMNYLSFSPPFEKTLQPRAELDVSRMTKSDAGSQSTIEYNTEDEATAKPTELFQEVTPTKKRPVVKLNDENNRPPRSSLAYQRMKSEQLKTVHLAQIHRPPPQPVPSPQATKIQRFRGLAACLNCTTKQKPTTRQVPSSQEPRERLGSHDMSTASYTLEDCSSLEQNLVTLFEADSEEERSMVSASVPLLTSTNRGNAYRYTRASI